MHVPFVCLCEPQIKQNSIIILLNEFQIYVSIRGNGFVEQKSKLNIDKC